MMKTLYFDCGSGAAGDMVTAALLEICEDKEQAVAELNEMGIPGITFSIEEGAVLGSRVRVRYHGQEEGQEHHHEEQEHHNQEHHHDHEHHGQEHHTHEHHVHSSHIHEHHSLRDIAEVIEQLSVNEKVKADAKAVFGMIAAAESEVHHKPMDQIHFHEVGTMDAVGDVTAACYLMDRLQVEKVMASPIHVGSGHVHCAHGILPVPAPATAKILRGVPIYGSEVQGELCTPTGAAILKYFVQEYGPMPMIRLSAIGYGLGSKHYATSNCLTAYLGEIIK